MSSLAFSVLFVVFFVLTLGLRFWLANRQVRHVLRKRASVPGEFGGHAAAVAQHVADLPVGLPEAQAKGDQEENNEQNRKRE